MQAQLSYLSTASNSTSMESIFVRKRNPAAKKITSTIPLQNGVRKSWRGGNSNISTSGKKAPTSTSFVSGSLQTMTSSQQFKNKVYAISTPQPTGSSSKDKIKDHYFPLATLAISDNNTFFELINRAQSILTSVITF